VKRLLTPLILLASLQVFAQSPVIRAHLEPAKNVMVGQPVRLVVSVFVPNYFTGSPEFPEFEIDNAIVVLPQDRPENSNTQIGNATYFGITQTYTIYPQEAGDFHIPPAKLSVPYATAPPKSTTAEVALPALSFHAEVPAAARDLPYFLPTTKLTITQHWSRPMNDLRAGDTVERTITVTASKMQAMLIPPLALEQPDGIRIYNGEPRVSDQKTPRGDFIYGQRVETAKYFIEKPGNYTLPAVELKWWNLATRKLVTTTLPAATFTAAESTHASAELPPPPEPGSGSTPAHIRKWGHWRTLLKPVIEIALLCVVLAFLPWLFRWLRLYIHKTWKTRKQSESACFRRFIRAARRNQAMQAYCNLLRWQTRAFPDMSLENTMIRCAGDETKREFVKLTTVLFSSDTRGQQMWSGDKLASKLRAFRRDQISKRKRKQRMGELASLNP